MENGNASVPGAARLDIDLASITTLDGLFRARVAATPNHPAYRAWDSTSKRWQNSSWAETAAEVGRWQAALRQHGLQPGDRVALNLRNSKPWVHFEQAALGLGLVVIPMYTDDRPDNIAYILQDTGARLLLLQDAQRWKRLRANIAELPELQHIIILEGEFEPEEKLVAARDWLPEGDHPLNVRDGDGDALATIVYTSGTSGRPKGVMLSHRNILTNAIASTACGTFTGQDRFLSFLPLAHMFERTAGHYLPILVGAEVCYARSINHLTTDIAEQQPTILVAVPRIFERIHTRMQEQLAKAPRYRRLLFRLAVGIGWRRFLHQQGRKSWSPALLLAPLTQRLVGDKLRERMGGRIRYIISGGAPLAFDIAQTFIALGLPLHQGYGMTEAAPVITVNRPEDNEPESIGPPLDGIEVRLGENDELLARGPNIMLGYWNNPEKTAETIDSEGWLHTGDQAHIGARGHVYITGRIKDIIVLSNGEKVPPADMELAICHEPLFEQALVIGEGRSFLSALLVVNEALWPELAQQCDLDPNNPESLNNSAVHRAVLKRLGELLSDFPGYAKVRKVRLSLEPWTVNNGLLTPTLKVKRNKVMEKERRVVEAFYAS